MLRFITTAACLAALIFPAGPQPSAQLAMSACGGEPIGDVIVASVTDGRTFLTTGGREVRLAGIEAPGPKAALETLIAGKAVTLTRAGGEDRYGRIVAYGQVADIPVQLSLLGSGHAYAAARIGAKACADALFAAERKAREAGLGLWSDPELGPKSAANRDEIARATGRFAVVEGRVLGVRDSGGTVYLNFGTYYTRDFSVSVRKRDAARFAAHALEGKRVRVRGVVEMRRGPYIEAERPEQIELIE